MKSRFNFFLVLAALIIGMANPVFVTAGLPEAVVYLQSQTQDPWITLALKAANQSSIPTDHLTSVSGNLATDYAKTILAVTAVGQDPTAFGNIDYVAKLKTYHIGGQMGDAGLLNDDIWSILALASVGQVDSTQAIDAKNFLISNQNVDGGFGYGVGTDSDTNDTAAAVIALIEAGIPADDQIITDALNYIQTAQNPDGGIGYQPGSASDSGSDAWTLSALYKAGLNPAAWDRSGNNPVTHLESLQAEDGGFWWVEEGTSEWNNKAMTAYAVIALAQQTFPIGYFEITDPAEPPSGTFHLRIEGANATICDANVSAATALDIIENGSAVCGYSYTIEETAYGPYLTEIAGESAEGLTGWLYFVDNVSPPVGAGDYSLAEGEEVLWYFGDWGWPPMRLTADDIEIDAGQTVTFLVEYFNGSSWLPVPSAKIMVNGQENIASAAGSLSLTLDGGIYEIYAEKEEFVRSPKITVTAGALISRPVGLQVEIEQSGTVLGQTIAMTVTPNNIDFGTLKPGQSASQAVTVANEGTVGLALGAAVSGDSVFTQGITLEGQAYNSYSDSLAAGSSQNVSVGLAVDSGYLGSGIKTGELVFWGSAQ